MSKDFLYPLRRIHGIIHENTIRLKFFIDCFFPLGKKFYIIGIPEHGNLGDSAICLAQKKFLIECGIKVKHIKEVTYDEYTYIYKTKLFKKLIHKKDVICFPGGGNMGNQWHIEDELRFEIIKNFPNNKMIIFPQSIYFTNDEEGNIAKETSKKYYANNDNLTVFARDNTSYSLMVKLYQGTKIMFAPDIVLSTSFSDFCSNKPVRNKILLCLRNDAEKSLTNDELLFLTSYLKNNNYSYEIMDMYSENDCSINNNNRLSQVQKKLEQISSAKLIITDRLHGMIFSAISGTPCIALSNYSHKINGAYKTIDYLDYIKYADRIEDVITLFPDMLNIKKAEYTNEPIQKYYDKLAEVVKKNC